MCFYSSPSCDGDQPDHITLQAHQCVSILPRLATGIDVRIRHRLVCNVSILPRLATGIRPLLLCKIPLQVSILPRLATGICCVFSD